MTPKQKVLKKYPRAYAKEGLMSGDWYIYIPVGKNSDSYRCLGSGYNARKAWEAVAQSLHL